MPFGDQLKQLRRAPMSIRERGVKRVLPVIVRYFVLLNAYSGRFTKLILSMSKHHFTVDENHLKE